MKIAIVFGAFLPVPPVRGGAVEKTWLHLAQGLVRRGHTVTIISRTWPGWPNRETIEGVSFLRLKGHDHYTKLWRNLLLDFFWSLRVARALPSDALVISHNIALPFLLRLPGLRHRAPVTVVVGRMPKGQTRAYGGIDRLYAPTRAVVDACLREKPSLRQRTHILPYGIDWHALQNSARRDHRPVLRIGFAGRIHPEKGIGLLIAAAAILHLEPVLPAWEIICIGPFTTPEGGGGADYFARLKQQLAVQSLTERVHFLPPVWDQVSLSTFYQSLDIFCYPSIAEKGETFGVAVVESMAAGIPPVVSNLACFQEVIQSGQNGLTFDHRAADAAKQLASQLGRLLRDPALRRKLGHQARMDSRQFDYENVAATLDADLRVRFPESGSS